MDRLRAGAAAMRDAQAAVDDAEAWLVATKARFNTLATKELPDLFAEAGTDHIGLPADGNHQACDVKLHNYYHAVIPKSDPETAFNWLSENDHVDIVKSTFTVRLGRGDDFTASVLRDVFNRNRIDFEEKREVPWQTLTAFVREQIEDFGAVLPLDVLGATVGTVAQIVDRKEKKIKRRE